MTKSNAETRAIVDSFDPKGGYDLIILATSAGGIDAVTRILKALPATLRVPIVLVLHRTAKAPEILPRILGRVSTLPVKGAEDGERLQPRCVYVAPADVHLIVGADETLRFTDGRRIKYVLSSANPLLESAASVLHNRVIAVVLTGSGSDGTDGVQAVKDVGGIVIAQNPEEAAYPGMPSSAIQSGAVDYVVSLDEIAPLLVRLTSPASPTETTSSPAPPDHRRS